jgi:hypothetical protein
MPRLISFMLGVDVALMIIGSLIPEMQGILPLGGSDLTQFGILIGISTIYYHLRETFRQAE